jgi:cyanophycin synthetase
MQFLRILTLDGPNIWSRHPVLEAWVDLEELRDSPSSSIPGFTDRLMAYLPSLVEHRCSVGERGGFLMRLREGTWPGHILEHVTLELQTLAGTPVGFGKAREMSTPGIYKVVVRYRDARLAHAALHSARELVLAAVYDRPFDIAAEVNKLRDLADRTCLGPSTAAIVAAAEARNIPVRRLNDGSLVELGHGKKARRIWTAETDKSSAIAGSIAQDKQLTKSLLSAAGVPVPAGRAVESAEEAWETAQEAGLPVVVKPRNANHGRGVFTGLTTRAQVERAYALAREESSSVLVERFAPGAEHRLLVVGGKLVAAARGDAAFVVGDGTKNVAQLIEEQLNSDPRRGAAETAPLCQVELDPMVLMQLEQQGHEPTSVPQAGERVLVQRSDNLSVDVTDEVHPQNAALAVLAARIIGLDVAGIDVVCSNIARPLAEQEGVFVEVNAGPGLLMHLRPSVGEPRPVGEAIVDQLFEAGQDGRVPLVCVTGTNGKTIVSELVARFLSDTRKVVGLASSDGVRVGSRVIERGNRANSKGARQLLLHPDLEAAVCEADSDGILEAGLGFDWCDVAVVTNIGTGDHLGAFDIQTPEQLFTVERCGVDVVLATGAKVLNAADPAVASMTTLGRGATIYFARDAAHPVMAAHRAAGGKHVYVKDGAFVLGEGMNDIPVARVDAVPLTHQGRAAFQIDNVLAALGAGWALGLSASEMAQSLACFGPTEIPGRLNAHEVPSGGRLILDAAHNADALEALIATLDSFPEQERTIVFSAGAARRADDIIRQGRILGAAFDRVVLYHDERASYETAAPRSGEALFALIREGLAEAPRTHEIVQISSPAEARAAALGALSANHLVVIQTEDQNPAPAVRTIGTYTGQEDASKVPDPKRSDLTASAANRHASVSSS